MKFIWAMMVGLVWHVSAWAGSVHVAVASNFTAPMKEIAHVFEKETGHRVIVSFGSTGKLYAQILHGAPYEVFLAADQHRPRLAEEKGLAVQGTRFTYALGRLALVPQIDLKVEKFSKLAMANPKTAPYGQAAQATLQALGVYDQLKDKLIFGENIAQTYQFSQSSPQIVGLVALSQVKGQKDIWVVPEKLHQPIAQDAVLLKETTLGKAFLAYLQGTQAKAIITHYGYGG
ncbi:molybdate ABC transporter substrate-binding protein [Terasakiella sp. SH-1]|uniref:molybdate ABC transporter substrate-binding protein n=1 Tax=Terasakiella sp. SH-1 TaxID=2560057 RepID=UPI0010730A15|nr:molybdate ABC transporter substrate-binding protein [Terasakiella sp. SH-1]